MDSSDFFKQVTLAGKNFQAVDFQKVETKMNTNINKMPFSARVILENLFRNLNTSYVNIDHIDNFFKFYNSDDKNVNSLIPFFPSRVLMQAIS